jgi:hypothetical protein
MTGFSPNKAILNRIEGIQKMLMALHGSGEQVSNATKGSDRENFIQLFLSKVLPPQFRFGSGDITDLSGKMSGQVDIVVEYPFLPSLPILGDSSRLYLAEGVAAVVEVKSNLMDQWEQVKGTSEKLRQLRRPFGDGELAPSYIPIFAVGYKGWGSPEKLEEKLAEGIVDGILVIENGLFIQDRIVPGLTKSAQGAWALWAFIVALHQTAAVLSRAPNFDLALYALPDLVLFHQIYLESPRRLKGEIDAFAITDKAGLERDEAKQVIEQFRDNGLLKIEECPHDELLMVSITDWGAIRGDQLVRMLRDTNFLRACSSQSATDTHTESEFI